jgi:hypothetical protein
MSRPAGLLRARLQQTRRLPTRACDPAPRQCRTMNSNPTPPRDLLPMWLDLSHVIAGLPVAAPAPKRPADASPRRGPPADELPADEGPAPGPTLRWALMAAAQLAAAGATAGLLKLIC